MSFREDISHRNFFKNRVRIECTFAVKYEKHSSVGAIYEHFHIFRYVRVSDTARRSCVWLLVGIIENQMDRNNALLTRQKKVVGGVGERCRRPCSTSDHGCKECVERLVQF
jgi:hypothetical protein